VIRALYLDGGAHPIFAMFDAPPEGTPTQSTAVLLSPPLGWQDVSSYRARRDWALALAAAGHPTLRIDLPGTGDSGGGPRDPGLLRAWIAALSAAAGCLRPLSGCSRVAAVGFGLGGLILYRALAEGAPVNDVVLWGVSGRGRAHTRENRAFTRLEQAQRRGPEDTSVPEGGLLTAGFLLTAETLADLDRLDVTAMPAPPRARRALLLERDGIAVDKRLYGTLVEAGLDVSTEPGDGFADMLMAEPHETRSANVVLAAVTAWIQQEDAGTSTSASDGSAVPPAPVALVRTDTNAEMRAEDGTAIRESPLQFEARAGQLFAVLTEPPTPGAPLCAVLLNAGAQRRIGVNRMWVEIARRWAARGVPTLRIDLEAIGDADGESARFGDIGSFYVPEFVEQVRSVLDELVKRGLPARFVMLGLCSGAYWSFQTALQDERVTAAMMLNPRVLVWDDKSRDLYSDRGHRVKRNATSLESWRRLLTSASMQRRLLRTAGSTVAERRNLATWARRTQRTRHARRAVGAELDHDFDLMRDRDQRGLVLFTAQEPLGEELERTGHLAHSERWPNIEFVTDAQLRLGTADNHTLRPLWLQQLVHSRLDDALDMELARVSSDVA
jgi:alpha-beta hydrolase superfamily lysophospholipase